MRVVYRSCSTVFVLPCGADGSVSERLMLTMTMQSYQEYRKSLRDLHTTLAKTLPRNKIMDSAKILGLVRNQTLIFDDEDQIGVVMDLAIYESLQGEETALDLYKASHEPENDTENEVDKELLIAMSNSKSSLFEIIAVSPEEHRLVYRDLLQPGTDEFVVTDIHFSQTARVGTVVFSRIIRCMEFNMSSGVAFPFESGLKQYLIKRHKAVMKKVQSGDELIRRYVAFFKLYRSEGIPTAFE